MPDLPADRNDADYLHDVRTSISSLWLRNTVMATITRRAPHRPSEPPWKEGGLSPTRGVGVTPEDIAAMNRQADGRQSMLEADPGLQVALARLVAAGVLPKWTGDGDYSFTAHILRLFVPLPAMSSIEEFSASDAGSICPPNALRQPNGTGAGCCKAIMPNGKDIGSVGSSCTKTPTTARSNDFGRQRGRA